jgi:flagellar biosynthesis regulator FlbT
MPLKMTIEPQDWFMIGNTKVINVHPVQAKILIDGSAPVLRGSHFLEEGQADTAAKRVYLAVQRLYLGQPKAISEYQVAESALLRESPAAEPIVRKASKQIASGSVYGALREYRNLIENT